MNDDIRDLPNLTSPAPNKEYQRIIREAVFKAILLATRDPESGQAILRNEDIITALVDLQAMMASSSPSLSSPTRVREWSIEVAKALKVRTTAFIEAAKRGESIFDEVIDANNAN